MTRWRVTVANVYTVDVQAENEEEAAEVAKQMNDTFVYDEQRILRLQRLREE